MSVREKIDCMLLAFWDFKGKIGFFSFLLFIIGFVTFMFFDRASPLELLIIIFVGGLILIELRSEVRDMIYAYHHLCEDEKHRKYIIKTYKKFTPIRRFLSSVDR